MTLSTPQRALVLGLSDLERKDPARADLGWTSDEVLEAARAHRGGESITRRTAESLRRRSKVWWPTGEDGPITLTAAGRRVAREIEAADAAATPVTTEA